MKEKTMKEIAKELQAMKEKTMKEIAKELQNRIIKETGLTCVIHIGETCDVLLGHDWSDGVVDDNFMIISNIIDEMMLKYPDKIEEGACAETSTTKTTNYLDHLGNFQNKSFKIPSFYKMQKQFKNGQQ